MDDETHKPPEDAMPTGGADDEIGGAGGDTGGAAAEGPAPVAAAAEAPVGDAPGADAPVGESRDADTPALESRADANGSRNGDDSANAWAPAASFGASSDTGPGELPPATGVMDWYILKVQSNREESIKDALLRRVKMQGMQDYFGEVIVPVEMVTEIKNGKKRVVKRKLYPGYIVARLELNDYSWFLVRETPGIGDFTGSGGKPSPMLPHEVSKILAKQEAKTDESPKIKMRFKPGDRVKITEGTFDNFEGDVDSIDEANGRVTVMINIFGRSTPVDLDYWQVETL